jgi:superfamily II DNA/RNA helicase
MLTQPVQVKVDAGVSSPAKIAHAYYVIPAEEQRVRLVHTLLRTLPEGSRSMVFCEQKYKVRRLAARLGGEAARVGAITGNHSQAQRERTLSAFRAGRLTSLIATDVAARGLDIPDVAQVIHYELPTTANSYVHRAGRTGRAEKEGTTLLILSPQEEIDYLRMVRRLRIETRRLLVPDLVPLPQAAFHRDGHAEHHLTQARRPGHHLDRARRRGDERPFGAHAPRPHRGPASHARP